MDALDDFVEFAHRLTFEKIPPSVVVLAKERLLDTVACAIGAVGCRPAEIGLSTAPLPANPALGGQVLGYGRVVAADAAAFVNTCLIRYLDFNDALGGLHPSDALGAVLAVAPLNGVGGDEVIRATVIAYEISCRIQIAAQLNERGWDQGFALGVGTAVALGVLLGLGPAATRHAAAITAVSGMHMRATRSGQLSMWKGAATAHATRDAVFAVQLAAAGMTGPERPFSGRDGLEQLITGPLEWVAFGLQEDDFLIGTLKSKYWPVVYNLQATVWCARSLRELVPVEELAHIEVATYRAAWRECGSEAEKWDPQTRETADHSLPYVLARSLLKGEIDESAFESAAYREPAALLLMRKTDVIVDENIHGFPDDITTRIRAQDRNGRMFEVSSTNPIGHERNRMTHAQLTEKFHRLCDGRVGDPDSALETWWSLECQTAARAVASLLHAPGGVNGR